MKGWFADWDDEATTEYGWQPCLETGIGHIPSFELWFKTKSECETWIAENVIGVGWLPGDPTEARVTPPEKAARPRHLRPHATFGDDPSGWCACAGCDPREDCGCPECRSVFPPDEGRS